MADVDLLGSLVWPVVVLLLVGNTTGLLGVGVALYRMVHEHDRALYGDERNEQAGLVELTHENRDRSLSNEERSQANQERSLANQERSRDNQDALEARGQL